MKIKPYQILILLVACLVAYGLGLIHSLPHLNDFPTTLMIERDPNWN